LTGSRILPLQVRTKLGLLGSLVATVIGLLKSPLSLWQLTMTSSSSVAPGLIVRFAEPLYLVPHPPFAWIWRSAVPSLRILNGKVRSLPFRQTGSRVTVALSQANLALGSI